jgi:AraC family transcriptional regulator
MNERISAIRNGRFEPLYRNISAPSSPSGSLLVERHYIEEGTVSASELACQVVTYFNEDVSVIHSRDGKKSQKIEIAKGSVVVSLRGEMERIEWLHDASILAVALDDRVLASASKTLFGSHAVSLTPSPGLRDARLAALFEALGAERDAGFPAGRLFVEGIEQAMASFLVTHLTGGTAVNHLHKGGMSPRSAKRVVDYVNAHLSSDISVAELAAIAGVSLSHFARSFRSTFDVTPHEFLVSSRISR